MPIKDIIFDKIMDYIDIVASTGFFNDDELHDLAELERMYWAQS